MLWTYRHRNPAADHGSPSLSSASQRPTATRSVGPMSTLDGKKIAFLATDGFEDSELTSPWQAVSDAGATVVLIAPESGEITGKNGHTQKVDAVTSDAEADEYYQSRPLGSRIGAWASKQSRPLEGRFALEKAVAEYTAKYALGNVPRPPHWSGFRIRPVSIEFWHDRPFRLHDRVLFTRDTPEGDWTKDRLYP